jgi:uroporphyrinogen decarboxylase
VGPPPPEGEDIWGRRFGTVSHGTGSYTEGIAHPLAEYDTLDEIMANYQWPSPDHWDYSHLPEIASENDGLPIRGGGMEIFLQYKGLRGEEQSYIDLIQHPEIVEYCLEKLFRLAYEATLRIFETVPGEVMISYVAEDLGGQNALLYSPDHIRQFLFPHFRRMCDLVRQHGSYVIHHDDGAIRDVLAELIEVGIQVLNPVQWRTPGMEREGLKRDFGDKLVFHGAMDNQHTLPFTSPAEVRQEVADNIRILGEDGGYILAPCHNIQSDTSPENVVAMYEAGYEMGQVA